MSEALLPITAARRTGAEQFHSHGDPLPFNLLTFWQWGCSDLVSNVTRGRLAEFIVACALDVDISGVRNEWDACDDALAGPGLGLSEPDIPSSLQGADSLDRVELMVEIEAAWEMRGGRREDPMYDSQLDEGM